MTRGTADIDDHTTAGKSLRAPDPDGRKGVLEDDRPCGTTNAPALDENGWPNDAKAIAEDSLGARVDGSQG